MPMMPGIPERRTHDYLRHARDQDLATDGILISLADYLAKLGPGSPAEQAELINET